MDGDSNALEEGRFPGSFFCPLTLQLLKDPVVDPEGNSYERSAIEDWLKKNSTSPITRNPLAIHDLVPNRALREAIEHSLIGAPPGHQPQPPVPLSVILPPAPAIPKGKEEKDEAIPIPGRNADGDAVDRVRLSVMAKHELKNEAVVMASIEPSEGNAPRGCDICCVVDISGSMGTEAKAQNTSGTVETHGLSLLDIVKHAVKTIINILHPSDRLSIVTYSSVARTVIGLTAMNEAGKKRAQKELEALKPDGQTNLWDGLYTGLEVLRNSEHIKGRLQSVLLLTDGLPNVEPPRGHLPMLKKYKVQHSDVTATINTFGFGYTLDSALLQALAIEGNGAYAFIPDSGFVGTAFVHATSNLLATMATNVRVSFAVQNGVTLLEKEALGGYKSQEGQIDLGSLQYGQTKNVVFRIRLPEGVAVDNFGTVTVKYETKNSDGPLEIAVEGDATCWKTSAQKEAELEVQLHRLAAVDAIRKSMALMKAEKKKEAATSINQLVKEIQGSSTTKSDERVKGLLEDLEGQVSEALSKLELYQKWGIHYLPSLLNAHLLQLCNNFKDPGVQFYGGKLFSDLRDRADDIFLKLPPPKPSFNKAAPPVQSMRYYHSSANPCFDSNCLAQMADGTLKKLKEIRKGDTVITPGVNRTVRVLCVVKTSSHNGTADLVKLGDGLLVTPFHPVRQNGAWRFPCDMGEVQKMACEAVYNFVLEEGHVMIINDMECVTLGHNFQQKVVKHPYFGSQKVVHDLQKMHGWNGGLVHLRPGCLTRDPRTSFVCGLDSTSEIYL